ncbi:MAG: diheme cytochrome c [Syntrophobacteraceae bacterium]
MKTSIKATTVVILLSALVSIGFQDVPLAHEDEHHGRKGSYRAIGHPSDHPQRAVPSDTPSGMPNDVQLARSTMNPVTNTVYKEQCGACHFAYQPELLPSGSWRKILGKLDDHFGEVLPLAPEMVDEIARYLEANAAERSSAKRAAKIYNSLKGATPLRITEVPYIVHKHREISKDVIRRAPIGSLSNCIACHRTAANGDYDDDAVSIPK